MAHGITLKMREIRRPAPEVLHEHFVPGVFFQGKQVPMTPAEKKAANLRPYVNPARDKRPGRRLRAELRTTAN